MFIIHYKKRKCLFKILKNGALKKKIKTHKKIFIVSLIFKENLKFEIQTLNVLLIIFLLFKYKMFRYNLVTLLIYISDNH